MKIIPSEESKKLAKVAKQLEKELNVIIKIKEKEVDIEGNPEDEYISGQVIEAVLFGFPIEAALLIKKKNIFLRYLT
jgi:rRNA processing protein Krr1/Pno1